MLDINTGDKPRQLILVRHARAIALEEIGGDDFSRPLSLVGENTIQIIAKYLGLIGVRPEMMFTSAAARTTQTAQFLVDRFKIQNFQRVQALYEAYLDADHDHESLYMSLLRGAPDEVNTMMAVGHGENLEKCIRYLTGQCMVHMDEGSLVVLTLNDGLDSWDQVGANTMKLVYYLTPRFLLLENLA